MVGSSAVCPVYCSSMEERREGGWEIREHQAQRTDLSVLTQVPNFRQYRERRADDLMTSTLSLTSCASWLPGPAMEGSQGIVLYIFPAK